jgi:poly-beta-1,6-N-acetyl-D-glucosamine N-deacetylase
MNSYSLNSLTLAMLFTLFISFSTLAYVNNPSPKLSKAYNKTSNSKTYLAEGKTSQVKIPKQELIDQSKPWSGEKIAVFGFHDIVNPNNPNEKPPLRRSFDIDYSLPDMKGFLEFLIKNDYWFLTSEEFFDYFVSGSKPVPAAYLGRKPVLITLDDGYIGVYNNLLPLLRALEDRFGLKVKVTVFINPGLMKTVHRDLHYMSCEQIAEGVQQGYFDLQSHALSHRDLTKITPKDLSFELSQSKRLLGECMKKNSETKTKIKLARFIAYPFGAVNAVVEQNAKRLYSAGFAYDGKPYLVKRRENNSFRISRLIVSKSKSVSDLINQLN